MFYLSVPIIPLLLLFVRLINSTCHWSPKQCGCSKRPPVLHARIVGGHHAQPNSWPWMVSIRVPSGSHFCGGALITDRYVLTAAHCFPEEYTPKRFTYRMGHHRTNEVYKEFKALRIVIHRSYVVNRTQHDIALVELEKPVDLNDDRLGIVCLPVDHVNDKIFYPPLRTVTWAAGWGALAFGAGGPNELLQVSVPITNNTGCVWRVTYHDKQVCAGYDKGGKDTCQGDSGGPLVLQNSHGVFEIVGIVSFGDGCAGAGRPGIYTRVTGYMDWIKENISKGDKTSTSTSTSTSPQPNPLGSLPEPMTGSSEHLRSSSLIFLDSLMILVLFL